MTTIFVGGCMRTGTAALQAVLCSTEDTNPLIHEAQYVTQLAALYSYAQRSFDRFLCHYLTDQEEVTALHSEMMCNFLERTRRRHDPAQRLVLKNPEMIKIFPAIDELLSNSLFVVTVRDPRDTIVSILEVARRQRELGQTTGLTKLAGNFEQHARHYNGYYAPVIGTGNDTFEERLLFVRYEDLVADTGTVVERLARFTGLDLKGFDAKGPWRSLVDFNDAQLSKEAFHAERRGKPLVADRIGIFRQVLPNKAIQTIERVCAPMMNRFGYD